MACMKRTSLDASGLQPVVHADRVGGERAEIKIKGEGGSLLLRRI